jgi:uncharacterized membrane protein YphA (DoxX/SURF4 family)
MKFLTQFFRVIVGVVFIISGFVKTIDPIGFSYKLEEYFGESVFNITFLHNLALPLSIFFVVLEVMLGVFLLFGVLRKFTLTLLLLLILFFSFLTFYSAYFHKVTDCGCFGDAIKLSPWTSFWKDIVLLLMILILVYGNKYIHPLFTVKVNYIIVSIFFVICLWTVYQGIAHLPIIDFRPYAVGKNLKEGMNDGEPEQNIITYKLKHSFTNEIKKINSDDYISSGIWKDTLTWKIIDTSAKITKEAKLPSIHDFSIECLGNDITQEILDQNKIVIITVPFAKKLSIIERAKLRKITFQLKEKKIKFTILTNDPLFLNPIYSCITDQTTLKTINRSNPGLMILKKGVVVAKYSGNDFPTINEIEKL